MNDLAFYSEGLKFIIQCFLQSSRLMRSCRRISDSESEVIARYMAVSSANNLTWDLTWSGRSLMYARNNTSLIRIRIVYWWNAVTTITHQDLWLGLPTSHQRSELSNTILCIFSRWDQRIGEGIPIPDSLGEEATFINICISNGNLKCHRVMISTTPSFGDKVICWYTGFTFKTLI